IRPNKRCRPKKTRGLPRIRAEPRRPRSVAREARASPPQSSGDGPGNLPRRDQKSKPGPGGYQQWKRRQRPGELTRDRDREQPPALPCGRAVAPEKPSREDQDREVLEVPVRRAEKGCDDPQGEDARVACLMVH